MNRSETGLLHNRRIQRLEIFWHSKIVRVLRAQVNDIIGVLHSGGINAAHEAAQKIIMIDSLGVVIRDMYISVGLMTANITALDIRKSARNERKGFGEDPKWTQAILNYFKLYLLNKAVIPISQTIREDIISILDQGVKQGFGIDKMAFALQQADFPVWRARMIVRTEIAKAQFYGRQIAEQDSDWETNKTWGAAHDGRTRHSHADVDQTTIPSDTKFRVEVYKGRVLIGYEYMNGPGDPEASAGNVINCRCYLTVRAVRDRNGRLIPKKRSDSNISVILPGNFVRSNPVLTI